MSIFGQLRALIARVALAQAPSPGVQLAKHSPIACWRRLEQQNARAVDIMRECGADPSVINAFATARDEAAGVACALEAYEKGDPLVLDDGTVDNLREMT